MAIDMNALRAKAKQKNAEKKPDFIPIELNEGNVQAIFNRCLADGNSTSVIGATLFRQVFGYSEDSQLITFDKKVFLDNKKSIEYLYGQLQDVQKASPLITPSSIITDYRNNVWTKDRNTILEFLHLGHALNLFEPFVKTSNGSGATLLPILATLSPKDPNFPAWWERNKYKWEKGLE